MTIENEERTVSARDEIARTRKELGDTVAALAAKADVKQQVRRRVKKTGAVLGGRAAQVKARTRAFTADARKAATTDPAKSRRALAAGGAVVVAGAALVTGLRIRHNHRSRSRPARVWDQIRTASRPVLDRVRRPRRTTKKSRLLRRR